MGRASFIVVLLEFLGMTNVIGTMSEGFFGILTGVVLVSTSLNTLIIPYLAFGRLQHLNMLFIAATRFVPVDH